MTSSVNKLGASLPDDARVVIYDRHMFIVQATGGQKFIYCCLELHIALPIYSKQSTQINLNSQKQTTLQDNPVTGTELYK